MLSKEEVLLILYFIAVLFFLAIFVILFFMAFQRRKNRLLMEKYEAQQRFQQELASSRLEIQEQTFKNIAWELHDNVGQLLSVANLQLNMLMTAPVDTLRDQISDTKDVIVATVEEVRSLSKTLNTEVVLNNGLVESVKTELERFNRLNFLHADLKIEGEETIIKKEDEIIIFRILQEFFSNVIKHAKADKLFVHLDYHKNQLEIVAEDDGEGFDTKQKSRNSGLQNMKSRASLLGANLNLSSQPGDGTKLQLTYPYPIYE